MNFLHLLTIVALLLSGNRISAMLAVAGALARTVRSSGVVGRALATDAQEGRTFDLIQAGSTLEDFKEQLYDIGDRDMILGPLLIEASSKDLFAEVDIILEHCNRVRIPPILLDRTCSIFGPTALQSAQSEKVAQRLLDAGMDVNGLENNITPLHAIKDDLIPFLLSRGADATLEDTNLPDYSLICQYYRYDVPRSQTTVRDRSDGYGLFDNAMMTAELEDFFKKEELLTHIHTFCDLARDERGHHWTQYYLHLTPIALALRNGNNKRLNIFLEHAQPEAVKPQLPKLTFLSKWMRAFDPELTPNYLEATAMLIDYERGCATRVLESPHV